MSVYKRPNKQLNLLHSYGQDEPAPVQSIQRPQTPEEAAKMMEELIPSIVITSTHNDEVMGKVSPDAHRILGDCAQFNHFKKATTYRQYSRCDHQNLVCYVVTAKALGFAPKHIASHWLSSVGKGNGGASYPMPMVLNLRTVKGDGIRFRWYPNRRAHQIEAFLFAQYDERNDGSAYVTSNGYCQRWHVSNAPQKEDAKGKSYYQINTHLLKQQGILQPFSVIRELVGGHPWISN